MCQTQKTSIMFINILRQHVSILIESSSGFSKKTDPYLEKLKCAWDPTAHFNISKYGSIFLEGPEDDTIRIETCCPKTLLTYLLHGAGSFLRS